MTDRDWFSGYYGPNSWTHKSEHPDTDLGQAWQADASAAVKVHESENLALTVIGGYRHYNVKYRAEGGSYIYSTRRFRDSFGTFPSNKLGISYEQTWDTPYAGIGAVFNSEDWTVSTEVIGSPFVMGRSRDYHAMRTTLFKDDFDMSGMVGASAGVEYRFSDTLSLAGRVEYQKYFEAKGGTQIYNGSTRASLSVPKPGAGADADTLLVTAGIKARL
jgi:outer membrane protease